MRYRELLEAPLADYQLHGDWSDTKTHVPTDSNVEFGAHTNNNSFVSKTDRKYATDISTQTHLKQAFAKHDVDFYLYLVNSVEMQYFLNNIDYGKLDICRALGGHRATAAGKFPPELISTLRKNQNPNSIQIILTHNEGGAERFPLTPWMICHRMVHALWYETANNTKLQIEAKAKAMLEFYYTPVNKRLLSEAAFQLMRNIVRFVQLVKTKFYAKMKILVQNCT